VIERRVTAEFARSNHQLLVILQNHVSTSILEGSAEENKTRTIVEEYHE
jgi:hypothetical protein